MGGFERVRIFKDTENICKTNLRINRAIYHANQNQKLILEKDKLEKLPAETFCRAGEVIVSRKRTFEAAQAYQGKKTAVLNFASAHNPGGGVRMGASAQEECLCRCSGLMFCLDTKAMWNGFYEPHRKVFSDLYNDDIIYTPDVPVFKSDTEEPKLLPQNEWYRVNVITCAAPNLSKTKVTDEILMSIHVKRLVRILEVAAMEGNEVLILGAFGCGAFRNDPKIVSQAMRIATQRYRKAFDTIEYAVYCSERHPENYDVFAETFRNM